MKLRLDIGEKICLAALLVLLANVAMWLAWGKV